jgi:hypothetical protein
MSSDIETTEGVQAYVFCPCCGAQKLEEGFSYYYGRWRAVPGYEHLAGFTCRNCGLCFMVTSPRASGWVQDAIEYAKEEDNEGAGHE